MFRFRHGLLAACLLPLAAQAATLTTVPMQGGMVMPMIRYDADLAKLEVMMPADIPQLTPLMVSNPEDQFDPAHPWFDDLDPSGSGLSFSRRYGFVMDIDSDPLPADTEIWLRKTSGPADLWVFRYSTSPSPGIWEPIFGTAGSPNALAWNRMMFHPAFAALPGTNGFNATFEAYLVDTQTGLEIPGAAAEPMPFQFTNVPDGRPEVMAGMGIVLDWEGGASNYVLEAATSLATGDWAEVTNPPVMMNGRYTVILPPADAGGKVFRARRIAP